MRQQYLSNDVAASLKSAAAAEATDGRGIGVPTVPIVSLSFSLFVFLTAQDHSWLFRTSWSSSSALQGKPMVLFGSTMRQWQLALSLSVGPGARVFVAECDPFCDIECVFLYVHPDTGAWFHEECVVAVREQTNFSGSDPSFRGPQTCLRHLSSTLTKQSNSEGASLSVPFVHGGVSALSLLTESVSPGALLTAVIAVVLPRTLQEVI